MPSMCLRDGRALLLRDVQDLRKVADVELAARLPGGRARVADRRILWGGCPCPSSSALRRRPGAAWRGRRRPSPRCCRPGWSGSGRCETVVAAFCRVWDCPRLGAGLTLRSGLGVLSLAGWTSGLTMGSGWLGWLGSGGVFGSVAAWLRQVELDEVVGLRYAFGRVILGAAGCGVLGRETGGLGDEEILPRLKKDMSAATTRWVATELIAPRLGRA